MIPVTNQLCSLIKFPDDRFEGGNVVVVGVDELDELFVTKMGLEVGDEVDGRVVSQSKIILAV